MLYYVSEIQLGRNYNLKVGEKTPKPQPHLRLQSIYLYAVFLN